MILNILLKTAAFIINYLAWVSGLQTWLKLVIFIVIKAMYIDFYFWQLFIELIFSMKCKLNSRSNSLTHQNLWSLQLVFLCSILLCDSHRYQVTCQTTKTYRQSFLKQDGLLSDTLLQKYFQDRFRTHLILLNYMEW